LNNNHHHKSRYYEFLDDDSSKKKKTNLSDVWLCLACALGWSVWLISTQQPNQQLLFEQQDCEKVMGHVVSQYFVWLVVVNCKRILFGGLQRLSIFYFIFSFS
jgi:hypothetical protein